MKTLLIASLISLVLISTASACELTLKVTSNKASTGKINEVNFGKKQLAIVQAAGCKVIKSPMTNQELMERAKKQYEAKVARLSKKK